MNYSIRILVLIASLLTSLSCFASALVESATGNVTARIAAAPEVQIQNGQRILPGSTVVTGPKSQTTLRFDDGQAVLLSESSEFRVTEYSFSSSDPAKDKFVFALLKGAVRSVTGLLTNRSSDAYTMTTPTAAFGIRGTDFMVALLNQTYLSVLSGAVSAANSAGVVVFGAGSTAIIASAIALPAAIAASALPASVAATFSEMSAVPLSASTPTASTGGAGAGTATGAAVGGIGVGAAIGIAALIGGILSVAADKNDGSSPNSGTGTR